MQVAKTQDISSWHNAPIIVSQNATKDTLNIAATEAFAQQTGRHLYWYHCTDTHASEVITDPELKCHLASLTSNTTGNQLGQIPLVIGMPVMIMTNFNVSNSIVNGRIRTLKSVTYWVDSEGCQHATSCVIESDGITGEPLPSLEDGQVAVLKDNVDITFIHPHSKQRLKIK